MTAELCMGLSYILDRAGDGKGAHAWSEPAWHPTRCCRRRRANSRPEPRRFLVKGMKMMKNLSPSHIFAHGGGYGGRLGRGEGRGCLLLSPKANDLLSPRGLKRFSGGSVKIPGSAPNAGSFPKRMGGRAKTLTTPTLLRMIFSQVKDCRP
jgi:hypothetical protein